MLSVFLVVLVDLIGFGIILPLLPFYAGTFGASAVTIGFLYSIFSIAQLIFAPFWGSLSDRIGRRPVMLISMLGASFAYLMFAWANSLFLLFVARFVSGMMGGNISAAQAYVADVTDHEDRAGGMGLIGAAFGIGFVLGPAISSVLTNGQILDLFHLHPENLFAIPAFFASLLSLCSFFLIFFKLPETVLRLKKNGFESGEVSQLEIRQSVFSASFWKFIIEKKNEGRHFFPALILSVFLIAFAHASLFSAFPIFATFKLQLGTGEVGSMFVLMGITVVAIQGILLGTLVRQFGEEKLFVAGSLLMSCSFLLIPFSSSKMSLAFCLCLLTLGGSLNAPTINSLVSKEANPRRMGRALGAAQGMGSLGRALGPAWGGMLYHVSYVLPFFATAFLLVPAVRIGFRMLRQSR